MRGRKTPENLIDEVRRLRKAYPAAEVVKRMADKLPRRTAYRILERLRREDEERRREDAERVRRALEREEAEAGQDERSETVQKCGAIATAGAGAGGVMGLDVVVRFQTAKWGVCNMKSPSDFVWFHILML